MIAGPPRQQKTLQHGQALLASAPLAARAGVCGQSQVVGGGDGARIQALQGRQGLGGRRQRLGHAHLPAARPALAAAQPADHTELGDLHPGDAVLAGPLGHPQVAGVGPAVARFLVAPQPGDAEAAAGPLQHLLHRPHPHHQGLTQTGQVHPQLRQALSAELPLPRRGIRLLPQFRLHYHQWQYRPLLAGLQQGPMIHQPQIPLEPDDLQRIHGSRLKENFATPYSPRFLISQRC